VRVDAIPVGLVIQPFTMINIAIRIDESTASIGLVMKPMSFVSGAFWPNLPPLAFALIIFGVPLAYIDGPIFETIRRPVGQILSLLLHVRCRGIVEGF
jgi:hypothetical protein